MVRIRLKRMGRRNRPFFRINAIDKRTQRDGKVLENLGWYDPVAKDPAKQLVLKEDRIKHWLEHGAQPSDTMNDILAKRNLIDAAAWAKVRKQRVAKKVAKLAADKAAAAAAASAAPAEAKSE